MKSGIDARMVARLDCIKDALQEVIDIVPQIEESDSFTIVYSSADTFFSGQGDKQWMGSVLEFVSGLRMLEDELPKLTVERSWCKLREQMTLLYSERGIVGKGCSCLPFPSLEEEIEAKVNVLDTFLQENHDIRWMTKRAYALFHELGDFGYYGEDFFNYPYCFYSAHSAQLKQEHKLEDQIARALFRGEYGKFKMEGTNIARYFDDITVLKGEGRKDEEAHEILMHKYTNEFELGKNIDYVLAVQPLLELARLRIAAYDDLSPNHQRLLHAHMMLLERPIITGYHPDPETHATALRSASDLESYSLCLESSLRKIRQKIPELAKDKYLIAA